MKNLNIDILHVLFFILLLVMISLMGCKTDGENQQSVEFGFEKSIMAQVLRLLMSTTMIYQIYFSRPIRLIIDSI